MQPPLDVMGRCGVLKTHHVPETRDTSGSGGSRENTRTYKQSSGVSL